MKFKRINTIISEDVSYKTKKTISSQSMLIQYGQKIYGSLANAIEGETKSYSVYEVFSMLFSDIGQEMPQNKDSVYVYFKCIEILEQEGFMVNPSVISVADGLDDYKFHSIF